MKLYYHPVSSYSQKALLALYEMAVEFEPVVLDVSAPDWRDAYSQTYSRAKIPLLVLDDGTQVPESSIIIEYLHDHATGGTALIPGGSDAAREVRLMDRVADWYLNEPVSTLLFQKAGFRSYTADQLATAEKHLRLTYVDFDRRLADRDWLCGDFSMADCAAIPPLFYAQTALPFDAWPHLTRYYQRACGRASYQKVREAFMPIWAAMTGG